MKAWGFTVVFIFIFYQIKAQAPFSHLSIEKGLSNNSVNAVYKDRYGFMWFGTDDGLNRYDGFSFNVFKSNIKDPESLIHNRIADLAGDNEGALWIGTSRGLSVFDHYTSRFSTPVFSYEGKSYRATDPVYTVKADDKGSVFVGVQRKGLLVRRAGQPLKQISFHDREGKVLEYNVYAIAFRPDQAWMVTNMGLCVYTISTDRMRLVSRSVRRANRMIAKDNTLWIATDNGLLK